MMTLFKYVYYLQIFPRFLEIETHKSYNTFTSVQNYFKHYRIEVFSVIY